MAYGPHRDTGSGWRWLPALLFFALAAGFLLSAEHRAHTVGLLPFLALLALCPLMHVFMHGGHGAHERATGPEGRADEGGGGASGGPARPHRH